MPTVDRGFLEDDFKKWVKKIDPDQDDYSLGQLGQVITQLHPDFDPRTYGSAKLSDLLRKTGRFEVFQGQNNSMKVRDKA